MVNCSSSASGAQSTVARICAATRGHRSQGWADVSQQSRRRHRGIDSLYADDLIPKFCIVLSLCVTDDDFGVVWRDGNPREWISRQVTEAFPWDQAPAISHLDRDTSYGRVFFKRESVRWHFGTIRSHPDRPGKMLALRRLIGSIRRECLDHMIVLGKRNLRRILRGYARLL